MSFSREKVLSEFVESFHKDVDLQIHHFLQEEKDRFTFSTFKDIWKNQSGLYVIHHVMISKFNSSDFTHAMFKEILELILSILQLAEKTNDEIKKLIALIFTLYCLYNTQICCPKEKIIVDPVVWSKFSYMEEVLLSVKKDFPSACRSCLKIMIDLNANDAFLKCCIGYGFKMDLSERYIDNDLTVQNNLAKDCSAVKLVGSNEFENLSAIHQEYNEFVQFIRFSKRGGRTNDKKAMSSITLPRMPVIQVQQSISSLVNDLVGINSKKVKIRNNINKRVQTLEKASKVDRSNCHSRHSYLLDALERQRESNPSVDIQSTTIGPRLKSKRSLDNSNRTDLFSNIEKSTKSAVCALKNGVEFSNDESDSDESLSRNRNSKQEQSATITEYQSTSSTTAFTIDTLSQLEAELACEIHSASNLKDISQSSKFVDSDSGLSELENELGLTEVGGSDSVVGEVNNKKRKVPTCDMDRTNSLDSDSGLSDLEDELGLTEFGGSDSVFAVEKKNKRKVPTLGCGAV